MFKAENTGTPAWKRIVDYSGKHIANLDENYVGDWVISPLGSREQLTDDSFSNGTKAANWLWKNREALGAPFSLYEDTKPSRKAKENIIEIPEVEDTSEDLFRELPKPMRKMK